MKSFVLALLSTTFIQATLAEENHAKLSSNYLTSLADGGVSAESAFLAEKAASEQLEGHF